MKKKIAMAFLLAVLLLTTGCSYTPDSSPAPALNSRPVPAHSAPSPFLVLEEWTEESPLGNGSTAITQHKIVVDTNTRVMYYQSTSVCSTYYHGETGLSSTFSVLLDADGTPRVYEGSIRH